MSDVPDEVVGGPTMDNRLAVWFAAGDTGISSETMALWLSARVGNDRWGRSTPSDPADLGRCLRLLEAIPEWKPRMVEMVECSPQWAHMMTYWDEIAASMADEVGIDWSKAQSAPLTYDLMHRRARALTSEGADHG